MLPATQPPLTERCREFASAFQHATIGMALVTPDGRFMQVNQSLCRILGYQTPQLLGVGLRAITVAADLDNDRQERERLLAGAVEHYQVEKRLLHRFGHVVHTQLSVSLICTSDGTPEYLIAQIQDISRHKQALNELRAANARLTTLVEQLPIGVVLEDEHRRPMMINGAFCELLGLPFTPAEIRSADCMSLTGDSAYLFARPEFTESRIEEIVQNRRPVHNETLEMADGRILRRDYIPVFVDDEYQGNLWTLREACADRLGVGR